MGAYTTLPNVLGTYDEATRVALVFRSRKFGRKEAHDAVRSNMPAYTAVDPQFWMHLLAGWGVWDREQAPTTQSTQASA